MNRHLFMLLGILVVLGGCSLTPEYTRPEAPVPTAWPTGPAYDASPASTDAAPVAEIAWREFFTDERMHFARGLQAVAPRRWHGIAPASQ